MNEQIQQNDNENAQLRKELEEKRKKHAEEDEKNPKIRKEHEREIEELKARIEKNEDEKQTLEYEKLKFELESKNLREKGKSRLIQFLKKCLNFI